MPSRPARSLALLLVAAAVLGGCGSKQEQARQREVDPEMAAALQDPIMTDPDLSGQNRRGAALAGGGAAMATVPLEDIGDEIGNAARAEALALAGGSLKPLPPPLAPQSPEAIPVPGETAMLTARRVLGAGDPCLGKVDFTMAWAARLPEPFPVYPRGHVQDAAGSDRDGCHLRVINYRVAVLPGDVLGFYYTRALRAGFATSQRVAGDARMLSGAKGAARYAVIVRPAAESGLTEVDLITR